MVCEALTDNDHVDATHVEISVKGGEVTMTGTVESRQQKRLAEDIVEQVSGVKDVLNQIRIGSDRSRGAQGEREPGQHEAAPQDMRHRT